jgi:RNA polymerase sigma-70 factor (ECF subfamily)
MAFRDTYRQELGYVCNSLLRLGVPDRHVDDLAHEVFLIAHRRFEEYDATRPIRPWLFGIALRVASGFRNLAAQRREVLAETEPQVQADSSPEDAAVQRQQRSLVIRALDSLDFDKRAVLIMHELDEQSVPDIAEALAIPLNTAYSRLRRSRDAFESEVRRLMKEAP